MAKEVGVPLVVVLATTSFGFEGPVRRDNSEKGLKRLYETADIVLKLPNERISQMKLASHDFFAAFRKVDEAVCLGIQALEDLFMMPKDLELLEKVKKDNFALDRHIHIGQGSCSGPGRIRAAWFQAKRPFWGECPDSKASSCFARLIHRGELGKEERDEFEKILGAAYPSAEVFRREYVRVDTLKEEVRLTLLTSTVGEPCELNVKPARRMKCLG
jgi:cell division GTPase FtsZ